MKILRGTRDKGIKMGLFAKRGGHMEFQYFMKRKTPFHRDHLYHSFIFEPIPPRGAWPSFI